MFEKKLNDKFWKKKLNKKFWKKKLNKKFWKKKFEKKCWKKKFKTKMYSNIKKCITPAGTPLVMHRYSASTLLVLVIQYCHSTGPILVPGTAPVLQVSTEWRYYAKVLPVLRRYS